MRKMFSDRARLVLYLEKRDLERLDFHARSIGKTIGEWSRETLLKQIWPKTLGEAAQALDRKPCKHGLLFCKKCA